MQLAEALILRADARTMLTQEELIGIRQKRQPERVHGRMRC
jgi:hypothetical protein